jgi:hypothetical protein
MIASYNSSLQFLALVIGMVCQTGFVLMYSTVAWRVNYIGRALMAKSGSMLLSLIITFLAGLGVETLTYRPGWEFIIPAITFADWVLAFAIALQWRALWRQQHEGELDAQAAQ